MGAAMGQNLVTLKMDPQERAYRKNEWKERQERKRMGLDDTPTTTGSNNNEQKKSKQEDYDKADVPDDYTMPVAILIPDRLMVGPPCVTKRQQAYVKERLGNPTLEKLVLPSLVERKLWKAKEAAVWYANYAKSFAAVDGAPLYLFHETGCKEEALVGLLVWAQWTAAPAPPNTHDSFLEWRERTGYLWFLDREEESLLSIALEALGGGDKKKSNNEGLITQWLTTKKK